MKPPVGVDPDAWRRWTPAAQQRALEALHAAEHRKEWRPFYCRKPECDGLPHDEWQWNHGRGDQHPPTDADWVTWLLTGGRGSGKTRAGSELVHRMTDVTHRIALVGATGPDARDIMVEGESGLVSIAQPGKVPVYEPSKRRLTWPNGCRATIFSGEEPDRLRGPEHGFAWIDEPAHMPLIQDVWDNMMFGLRIGKRPRVVATTTPKPRPWLKKLIKDSHTRLVKVSTYQNLDNLAPTFKDLIISRYEGTRLGRQELHGDVLEDVEGALWNYEMIETGRLLAAPELVKVVVAIDPAGSANKRSDETGIVAVGRDRAGHVYVLKDRSGKYSPAGWARAADALCEELGIDTIIAEKNYGGDMVKSTFQLSGVKRRVLMVNSRKGKAIRAEPIVGFYEQNKVHHIGILSELEDQQCTWEAYEDTDSPDRVDALVHGITYLVGKSRTGTIASPTKARRWSPAIDELDARRQERQQRERARAS